MKQKLTLAGILLTAACGSVPDTCNISQSIEERKPEICAIYYNTNGNSIREICDVNGDYIIDTVFDPTNKLNDCKNFIYTTVERSNDNTDPECILNERLIDKYQSNFETTIWANEIGPICHHIP